MLADLHLSTTFHHHHHSPTLPSLPSVSAAITISTMYILGDKYKASKCNILHATLFRAIHFSRPNVECVLCARYTHSTAHNFHRVPRALKIYLIGMKWQRNRQLLALIYCHFVHLCACARMWVCVLCIFVHIQRATTHFKVAHWTITTWLVYETTVWHIEIVWPKRTTKTGGEEKKRTLLKPILKLNANPRKRYDDADKMKRKEHALTSTHAHIVQAPNICELNYF